MKHDIYSIVTTEFDSNARNAIEIDGYVEGVETVDVDTSDSDMIECLDEVCSELLTDMAKGGLDVDDTLHALSHGLMIMSQLVKRLIKRESSE